MLPSDLEALIVGAAYRPEPWRVRAGGGVARRSCMAEIARPRKKAVSNQCAKAPKHKFGRLGFCKTHHDQIVKAYQTTIQLTADDSFFVNY